MDHRKLLSPPALSRATVFARALALALSSLLLGSAPLASQAPAVKLLHVDGGAVVERGACVTLSAGPGAASECADLRLGHALPGVRTMNRGRAPVLLYSAQSAYPVPFLHFSVTLPAGSATPDYVTASVYINGAQRGDTWYGDQWAGSGARYLSLGFDAHDLATGLYAYTLEVASWRNGVPSSTTVTGKLPVVNRGGSPFNPGWWLAGLEQLVPQGDGSLLWVGGDGSTRQYRWAAPGVWTAASVTRPDTLLGWTGVNGQSYYRRLLPGGAVVWFDASGRHVQTESRTHQLTRFVYTSAGLLDSLVLPVPAGAAAPYYHFSYEQTSGRLTEVSAPGEAGGRRYVEINFGTQGIQWIQDPDGAVAGFGYDGVLPHRVTSHTDARGTRTDFAYRQWTNTLVGWTVGAGTPVAATTQVSPQELQGSFGQAALLGAASTFIDGPRLDVGDTARIWQDSLGAPSRIRDALGSETYVTRGDARFPALPTQVDAPGGGAVSPSVPGNGPRIVSRAHYNARGNMDTTTVVSPLGDGQNAVTAYAYANPAWPDFVTRVTSPAGVITAIGYDDAGNRAWQQVGSELPTVDFGTGTATPGDSTRRVHFHYNSLGLVDSAWTAQAAAASPRPHALRLTYDTLKANLASVTTPLGFQTQYYADAIGRDTLVVPSAGAATHTYYDLADQDTLTITAGDATEGTLFVRTRYEQGLARSVTRWSSPDPAGIGAVVTSWDYDALGRPIRAFAEDSAVTITHFDLAGNPDTVVTRRGYRIATTYDVLNRPTRRIVPQAAPYAVVTDIIKDSYSNQTLKTLTFPNPAFANGPGGTFVPPADTSVFAYDGAGNLVQADNHDARISRTYFPNGLLRADTLRTRTWAELGSGGSFSTHVYGLQYAYDIEGRRTSLKLPNGVAPRNSGTGQVYDQQAYGYNTITGALAWTRDVLGNEFDFTYDAEGALDRLEYPGSRWQKLSYDADGRVSRRQDIAPKWTAQVDPLKAIHDYTFQYDARNKLKSAMDASTLYSPFSTSYDYTKLGALAQVQSTGGHNPLAEVYQFDALGNRLWVRNNAAGNDPSVSHYEARTGRLLWSGPDGTQIYQTASAIPTIDVASYDAAGNQDRYYVEDYGASINRVTHSYFSADDRLVATDNQACKADILGSTSWWTNMVCEGPATLNNATAGSFEWYRYDALGRRVLVRTRRDVACNGSTTCGSTAVRTVWDGDQVLMELRADGSATGDPENDNLTGQAYYGKVAYTHAGGIDAPLDIIRMGYTPPNQASDTVDYHWGAWGGPYAIVPHTNARGAFDGGTTAFGHQLPCSLPSSSCTVVAWPGANYRAFYTTSSPVSQQTWYGSLIDKMTDASGLMYMRNRYYNPQTGAFTQRDPIGIDGGLNVYGFASGDPVNFGDPYGLAKDPLNFGQGYTGRVDQVEGETTYEIHVYDRGREVGVFGPEGWINKHGAKGTIPSVPRSVLDKINGENVGQLRRRGIIGEKGTEDIHGGRYSPGVAELFSVADVGLTLLWAREAIPKANALHISVWTYMSFQLLGYSEGEIRHAVQAARHEM